MDDGIRAVLVDLEVHDLLEFGVIRSAFGFFLLTFEV